MTFFDLLIDPESKELLKYDKINNHLIAPKANKIFSIIEGIPVVRVDKSNKADIGIHQEYNSSFDYLDHYEKDAKLFNYFEGPEDKATIHENKRLHEAILQHIPDDCNWVLDTGCGNAWVAKALVNNGIKVISMDISTSNPLKALTDNPHPNHFGLVANAFNLPLKEKSIDCIIASEIMEHVDDPKAFVNSLLSVLKPGGTLIITTPYNEKIEYSLCVHCNKPTPRHAHLHSFNEHNIKKLIPHNTSYQWDKFSNKYLIKLRLNILLSFLPYSIFKLIDKIANKIFKQELRLLIKINA